MAEYNPRQLTKDQYTQLKDSLTRFGMVDPLIVNKHKSRKNILVGGHQRLKIAKEMGMEKIPCVEVDLPLDQEKELNIRLNKNVGEWDYDSLANYFDVGELMEWGFSNDELQFYEEEPEQGLTDDDEIPEVEEAITKSGDIWLLGEHRVLCGDATKKADVDALMGEQKADMVFTDPPYGMNLDTDYSKMVNKDGVSGNKHKNIIGDSAEYDPSVIFNSFSYCSEIVLFGADYYSDRIIDRNSGSWLIWDKRVEDKFDKVIGSAFEMMWSKKKRKREIIRHEYSSWGNRMEGSINGHKPHPSMKPIAVLIEVMAKTESKNVVDIYLGSGSTLIACEKTKRKCYGMEIDPHYCDVIVKRWEEFTGNKAERVERAEC